MSTTGFDGPEQRARREAAEWLAKHDRGLTATEQDEFFQWLAGDAHRGNWFYRHRDSWNRLNRIANWRPENGSEPNPDVLAGPAPLRRWWQPTSIAILAAAAAAVVATTVWIQRSFDQTGATQVTHVGGYERRMLEDGTVVELNEGAELEVNFTPTERRVSLSRGEALFTVTKNPQRPFIVRARGVDVRAVGTAFNVRVADTNVEVLVTEGKVQVAPLTFPGPLDPAESAAPSAALVTAGETAIVPHASIASPTVARTTDADLARLTAWQPQLLDFSSTPLSQVLIEFNRRNRLQMVLADRASADVPIVASIRSDNIDGFVRLLTIAAVLHAERTGEYEIVLHPMTPSTASHRSSAETHR